MTDATSPVLSVDAMGGDRGPEAVVAGLARAVHKEPAMRFVLHGDEALATLSPATAYHDNRLMVSTWDGTERTVGVAEQSDVQFHREMDHLSQAIRNGTDVRTPAAMGLRDVRLIEAIYTSAMRGAWVDLDEDGRVVG